MCLARQWLNTPTSLSYNPSNQGLKLLKAVNFVLYQFSSLSYNPSNQGLKPYWAKRLYKLWRVFILQSIKPRVETAINGDNYFFRFVSLSYNPSNQGLKPDFGFDEIDTLDVFILQSIKPRVETNILFDTRIIGKGLYPTIHQTKG